jgi:hypothetical protein
MCESSLTLTLFGLVRAVRRSHATLRGANLVAAPADTLAPMSLDSRV